MALRSKPAAGEGQMPLFLPDSGWTPPTELPDLRRVPDLVIDVENRDDGIAAGKGSGWPYRAGHISGIAAGWYEDKNPKSIYIPLKHEDSQCFDHEVVKRWLADHFAPGGPSIITHHGSHDWGWLCAEFGLSHAEKIDDTEAMAVMVDENRFSYRLDDICKWRGIPGKDEQLLRETAAAFQYKGKDVKGNMWRFPARFVGPYAEQDAIAELLLAHDLRPTLHKEKTWNAYRLEMDLMPVTHEMRRRGIRIDVGYAHQVKADLIAKRDAVLVELSDLLAMPMTITECRSPKFLEKAFDLQHIDYPRTPKTRQGSFTSDWMRDHEHWLPRLVSRAEQFESAGNKFVQGYLIDYAVGGRLHATVNQFRGEEGGTKSHRFSYSDPPLQQMPARDEEFATPIRGIFQPEPGEVWLSADYSQQEYRLIVHYAEMSKLPRAKQAGDKYRDNPDTDFHSMVVDWTGLDRRSAKNANFAKSYGAGIKKFAKMIEQDEEEARRLYNKYDRELPFVTQLAMRCQRLAEGRGYIKLCDGARSHFDLWEPKHFGESSWGARPKDKAIAAWGLTNIRRYDCRKAMNRLIQGSAARQTKAAIRACARAGYIPMLQMHDELCFSITSQKQADEITELMREAAKMYIPSKVDAEFGPNWGAAKHKDFVMSPIPKAAPAPKQEKKPRKIKQKVEHPFIILTPDQEAYAEEIARKRTTFARKIGRKHTNTPVQFSDEHAFKLDRESCPSELACSLMLGEDAKWVAYTEGSVSGLPEITWRGLSIDVKAIQKSHHKLIVKKNDPVGWIFVLALREGSKHTMLGWVSGERAKQAEFWDDPVGGRAAFFAPQSVLLPFSLLLETVDPNV